MKKNTKTVLKIVAALILILPTLLRFGKPLPGEITYYYVARSFDFPEVVFRFLPLLLGVLSCLIFYNITKSFKQNKNFSLISTLLFAVSIPFLYVSSIFTDHCILLFMILLGFFLLMRKKRIFFYLSGIVFIATSYFGVYSLVTVLFLLTYTFVAKENRKYSITLSILILLLSPIFFSRQLASIQPYIPSLISDFGGTLGMGVSAVLLAIFGIIFSWKHKYLLFPVYIAVTILLILSNFLFFVPVYLNIFVVLFAAYAFEMLLNTKWDLKFVKMLSIIALLCTFLFSSVSFSKNLMFEKPNEEIMDSLIFLKSQPKGVVLSHPSNSFWLRYVAEQPVFIDRFTSDSAISDTAETMFYSREIRSTLLLFNQTEIKYIWIDEDMKQRDIWTKPDQGLLLLLTDTRKFEQIYKNDEVEILEYHP